MLARLLALCGGLALSTGCIPDRSLQIVQNNIPELSGESCDVPAGIGGEIRASGVFNVQRAAAEGFGYVMFPAVQNNLPATNLIPERNLLVLNRAQVDVILSGALLKRMAEAGVFGPDTSRLPFALDSIANEFDPNKLVLISRRLREDNLYSLLSFDTPIAASLLPVGAVSFPAVVVDPKLAADIAPHIGPEDISPLFVRMRVVADHNGNEFLSAPFEYGINLCTDGLDLCKVRNVCGFPQDDIEPPPEEEMTPTP